MRDQRRPSPAWRLLLAFALTHVVFATWPALDLHASRLAFDGTRFALADSEVLGALRYAVWTATVVVGLGSLALGGAWLALGRRARVAPGPLAYPGVLMLLGPGLLVNGLLKEHWGRARPADVEAFGGEATFTPPFEIANQCAGNCSFVSGEGAGAVALALGLGALTRSTTARVALGVLAAGASLLRVAMGRHFLSDIVFGAFLMAFLAVLLHRVMRIDRDLPTLSRTRFSHDLGLFMAPFLRG